MTDCVRVCRVDSVRAVADPTVDWPWLAPPVGDWAAALAEVDASSGPVIDSPFATFDHVGRVKWFVENGWDDPVLVEFVPGRESWWWPVQDGNHRLVAAILRGDNTIRVTIAGDVGVANRMLRPNRPW